MLNQNDKYSKEKKLNHKYQIIKMLKYSGKKQKLKHLIKCVQKSSDIRF